ncbi:MAG: MaoC family dehydratase [Nanoarchaeota archaeon]|nr:MaoC family dehydratase [Nanoarchaeota archaeon]
MEIVRPNATDWVKYADAVGDYNPIHRDVLKAREVGLEGIVAPGMYLASHVQENFPVKEAEFCFNKPVYDGDEISKEEYSFYKNGDRVCRGNVILGKPTNRAVFLPKEGIVYSGDFSATDCKIEEFLDSVKFDGKRFPNPEMYLMALSAPALLGYAKSKGLTGVHAYQSMEVCKSFDLRDINVAVEEEKIGRKMSKLNLYWISRSRVVAVGKSKVLPVSI